MTCQLSKSKWFASVFLPLITLALSGTFVASSYGEVIELKDQNSSAIFHTEADDGGTLGLNSWIVDGVEHMEQQWFWYRVGSGDHELAVSGNDPLSHVSSTPLDLDGDSVDDFLLVSYEDNEVVSTPERFRLQFRFLLTGGTSGSNRSDMIEVIRLENTSSDDLEFHLYQYANFDLSTTADNDSVVITGGPRNTVRQVDPSLKISEMVVTPPPSHWEAATPDELIESLDDQAPTTWGDISGPILGFDAAWSFQWDFAGNSAIAPGGTVLISKDKNIRPGEPIVPEPSSFALAALGILAMLFYGRRKRGAT